MKGRHCHEFALRVILKELNGHAARYKRAIEPLVSLSVDFYCRVFVRVFDSPIETKGAFSKVRHKKREKKNKENKRKRRDEP